mmetsp:Transcript_36380/g.47746  ORF Transcript_36380/g.47746 Transcript_36380/m.47746 type:complete len:204 (+) Transcript_36380:1280-1891(+)
MITALQVIPSILHVRLFAHSHKRCSNASHALSMSLLNFFLLLFCFLVFLCTLSLVLGHRAEGSDELGYEFLNCHLSAESARNGIYFSYGSSLELVVFGLIQVGKAGVEDCPKQLLTNELVLLLVLHVTLSKLLDLLTDITQCSLVGFELFHCKLASFLAAEVVVNFLLVFEGRLHVLVQGLKVVSVVESLDGSLHVLLLARTL